MLKEVGGCERVVAADYRRAVLACVDVLTGWRGFVESGDEVYLANLPKSL